MSQFITNKKIKLHKDTNKIQVALSCVILLFLWEAVALKINNDIYLPTLEQVCLSMKEIIFEERFILNVFSTISRCILSFLIALVVSFILGIISYTSNIFRNFLMPMTSLARSIPNMVLIVLS